MTTIGKVHDVSREFNFEWRIDDFFSIPEEVGKNYNSPSFLFAGESWYLKIYPNGGEDSVGCIDVHLFRKLHIPPISMAFSLGLKTIDGQKDHEISIQYVFQKKGTGIGAHRLVKRAILLQKKSQLVTSGVLTIVCTIKSYSKSTAGNTEITECSYCKESFDANIVPFHEQRCLDKPIQCPTCADIVALRQWFDHECDIPRVKGSTDTTKCSHCKESFDTNNVSSHGEKCLDKPIKCPTCADVVALRKWFDHECEIPEEKAESCSLESTVSSQENKVLRDLKKLFLEKEDCDVVLKVQGQEFPAHKSILKVRSSVFASTFRIDMKEKKTGVVEIEDCDPSSFSDFLCFLYCGDAEVISEENVFSLFTAADKYDIQDLRAKCLEIIKEKLSVDTFCDTITLALRHSEIELIKLATDFFITNASKIILTVKWQSFLAENPTESNELLVKFFTSNSSNSCK